VRMRPAVVQSILSSTFCLALAACASPVSPSPEATLTAPTPTLPPVASAATPTPVPTPEPISTATAVSWSELELAIQDGIRGDAAFDCAPRRHDLPRDTIAAVECRPGEAPIARVGIYLFPSPEHAFEAYLNRIRDEGLTFNHTESQRRWERCWYDLNGERGQRECRTRHAGFVNSDGYGNYRAVMDTIYIGVLGTNDDVNTLLAWSWSDYGMEQDCGGDTCAVPEAPTLYSGELLPER
jgi:hypothetical protein